jgi:hypothetical protein
MPKFKVTLERTESYRKEVIVEAANEDLACDEAFKLVENDITDDCNGWLFDGLESEEIYDVEEV